MREAALTNAGAGTFRLRDAGLTGPVGRREGRSGGHAPVLRVGVPAGRPGRHRLEAGQLVGQ
jgi:hypothetical protein